MLKKFLWVGLITGALLIIANLAGYWWFPKESYHAAMAVERWAADLETKEIMVHGHRWVYSEGGKGEPLLLLHGFSVSRDNWSRLANNLGGKYRLIIPDMVGFGQSDLAPDLDYSIDAQAQRVWQFIDRLNIDRIHIGGNSMGGYIAGAMANSQPQRVDTLWLLDPGFVAGAQPSDMMRVVEGGGNPLIVKDASEIGSVLDFTFVEPPILPPAVLRGLGEIQAPRYEHYAEIFEDMQYRSPPLEEYVRGLQIATLVVWGEADRVLDPSGAEVLAEVMPRVTVEIMPDIGHLPMIEAPKKTAKRYIQWRREL